MLKYKITDFSECLAPAFTSTLCIISFSITVGHAKPVRPSINGLAKYIYPKVKHIHLAYSSVQHMLQRFPSLRNSPEYKRVFIKTGILYRKFRSAPIALANLALSLTFVHYVFFYTRTTYTERNLGFILP